MNAVEVPVQQVARCDLQAADVDGYPKFNNVRIGVRDAGAAGETRKGEVRKRAQIADDPVGEVADASERPPDFGMDLAEKGPCPGHVVEILNHHDLRPRIARYVAPPVRALVVAMPRNRRGGGSNGSGYRVSDGRRQSGEQATGLALYEALIAHADVERLNGVRYAAGVGAAKKLEDLVGNMLVSGHDTACAEYRVIGDAAEYRRYLIRAWILHQNGPMQTKAINGVVSLRGRQSVDATVDKLKSILQAKNVKLFAMVDHSGEARNAGLQMPNTKLLIFGNPAGGTPAMLSAPTLALDLPLKILVWEDTERQVWISYNSVDYLRERHGVAAELAQKLEVVAGLAAAAAA